MIGVSKTTEPIMKDFILSRDTTTSFLHTRSEFLTGIIQEIFPKTSKISEILEVFRYGSVGNDWRYCTKIVTFSTLMYFT